MTVVTDEEAAQIERLAYILGQSVKENLVERVCQWPGVHCAGCFPNDPETSLPSQSLPYRYFRTHRLLL